MKNLTVRETVILLVLFFESLVVLRLSVKEYPPRCEDYGYVTHKTVVINKKTDILGIQCI